MNEVEQTGVAVEPEIADSCGSGVSIRVSPHSYLTALLIGSFFSAFLFYLEFNTLGVLLFALAWILIPFFALNDKISFDGKRLDRTGLIPRLWRAFNVSRGRLRLADIEQVETQAVRAVKRAGNIYYRYRTVIRGKGLTISISSGGEEYRRMIKGILPRLAENVLDARSIELRDFLADPKETLMRAEFSHVPSADVLESSYRSWKNHGKKQTRVRRKVELLRDEKAEDLRSLANELRLGGYLFQALEVFRRALVLRPTDAQLLFEFARCLHSFAGVERSKKLERRALAALRLSERCEDGDGDLLVRLGECYFQIGEWRRADSAFQRALEGMGENFRTARGLAEIALREGKIAHVIHHFSTANRLAETPSLKRWSRGEADYFSNLNSDEEYMELEIRRVKLLDTCEALKKSSLRTTVFAFPLIVVGIVFEDTLVADLGWAISSVSLLFWTGLIFGSYMLGRRIPYNLVDSEE